MIGKNTGGRTLPTDRCCNHNDIAVNLSSQVTGRHQLGPSNLVTIIELPSHLLANARNLNGYDAVRLEV